MEYCSACGKWRKKCRHMGNEHVKEKEIIKNVPRTKCAEDKEVVTTKSWIVSDREQRKVWVHLGGDDNRILRISGDGVEEMANGDNSDGVLLDAKPGYLPISYLPDCNPQEGVRVFKELVLRNIACDGFGRVKVLDWLFRMFLLDIGDPRQEKSVMKFTGPCPSGKTSGASLLSALCYGFNEPKEMTAAAAYSRSEQNPLVVFDNLEMECNTKHMRGIERFMLISATRGYKEKRVCGSRDKTEKVCPKALVLVTSIEPFLKQELVARACNVDFSRKYFTPGFDEDEAIKKVVLQRDLILSSIIKLTSERLSREGKDE